VTVDKIWAWKDDEQSAILQAMQSENFDLIVDLHKNLRSLNIRRHLKAKTVSFDKINLEKWLMVNLKWDRLPDNHLVDRYFEGIKQIGINNDNKGLDFYIPENTKNIAQLLPELDLKSGYICLALGAAHATKRLPLEKLVEIIQVIDLPIILLGGKNEQVINAELLSEIEGNIYSIVGKASLHESASCINSSLALITPDTGMMHIAAALKKPIIAIWGNTIPKFGMQPYYPSGMNLHKNIYVDNLSCRPCSKIGKTSCPKGHFKCMKKINVPEIRKALSQLINP